MTNRFRKTVKAVKATIQMGSIPLDVYLMPDGSYKLYIDSVTRVVGDEKNKLLSFMRGKSLQAKPFKNYSITQAIPVEVEDQKEKIKPIPINLATAFWLYKAIGGNEIAQALAQACMMETIERRADTAFKFKRTEEEYNRKFAERFEEFLSEYRQEIKDRRLPGDDLYLPRGIN
ncbi:MAG: hypothetical protein N5P05_004217 (plasmid) [Chroococcopsis gigantea SAG 12.99]|jgi:hypothetical protein|nr:hypothetical protein [Chroococcopsis gigantea SAG 12.99]